MSEHAAEQAILLCTFAAIDHNREMRGTYLGPPQDHVLVGRYVAAICPVCGGWTMMHADPTSAKAKEWARNEYVLGNLIVYWRNPISLSIACPQSDRRASERTCS